MPFGRSAEPGSIRGYEYGCLAPVEGEQVAVDAMHRRLSLWNRLVEMERKYQSDLEAILAPHLPPEGGVTAEESRAARRAAFKLPEVRAAVAELDRTLYQSARTACRESGLFWCNYESVLVDFLSARRRPGELRFHAWRNEIGKVTVRWQTGLPVPALFGTDTRAQVDPVPELAWTSPVRAERRRLARTTLRVRVASENRKPVWLVLPMVMHRPLPADGLVREISVLRERVGLSWRWKAVMVVETPSGQPVQPRGSGVVAVDIGWRKLADGLRVCAWADDRGGAGDLVLPERWIREMVKTHDIRSIRDQRFNLARDTLAGQLSTFDGDVPVWLREAMGTLRQWRSPARLAGLYLRWRTERFNGDGEMFADLESWYRRERHLYEYEANLRDQLIRSRREMYRRFAADLAGRYAEVVIEEFDIAGVARVKKRRVSGEVVAGKGSDLPDAARHQRVLAAPSVLRLAIRNACEREGVRIRTVPAAYTTLVCHVCGSLERFDAAGELVHRCSACGAVWDQDVGAARNLLDPDFSQKVPGLEQKTGLRNGMDATSGGSGRNGGN